MSLLRRIIACLITIFLSDQLISAQSKVDQPHNRVKRQLHHNLRGRFHLYNHDVVIKYALNGSMETEIPWIHDIFSWFQKHTCLNFELTNMTDPAHKMIVTYDDSIFACHAIQHEDLYYYKDRHVRLAFDQCINLYGSGGPFHEIQHVLGAVHPIIDLRSNEFFIVRAETKINKTAHYIQDAYNMYGFPFDIGSNMNGFNVNDGMPPTDKFLDHTFGHPFPTFTDIRLLNAAYKCRDLCDPEDTFRCSVNKGLPDSRNCSTCLCPDGFEGPTCTDRRRSMFDNPPCGTIVYATDNPQILTIDIKRGKNYKGYDPKINRISQKPLHPNVCVWHVKAPLGYMVSLKVVDPYPNMIFQNDTVNENSKCNIMCLAAHLEIQLRNFDLKGYKVCCLTHVRELPTLYSDGNLAVLIAVSGRMEFHPLNVTYAAVEI